MLYGPVTLMAGAWTHELGSACGALRDIARNSFH
jgi:hypothetical protein